MRIGVVVAACATVLFIVDTVCGATGLGVFPVTIAATFVDDATGEPIGGVSVLTLRDAAESGDLARIEGARDQARSRAGLSVSVPVTGVGRVEA